jgi:ribose transport system substrate-binding protein
MATYTRRGGLMLAAALYATLFGCPKEQSVGTTTTVSTMPGSGSGTSETKRKIAFIPKGTSHNFWQTMKQGAEKAAAEENVELVWVGPSNEKDIVEQVNIVQNQITAGVDGIVLAATDAEALVAPVEAALAKNIPVITVDSGIKKDIAHCYIATDNVEGGRRAAEALAKAIGEKGKVGLMLFMKGSVSNDEREKGFKEGLKKYPNITLASELYANDPAESVSKVTNMMTASPDIVGIFAANEPNGTGVANYLKQAKKEGQIKLVAYDSSPDEIKFLEEGTIQALIVQDPYRMGYEGIKTALKAIRKETIEKKFIDSGVMVITKENMTTPEAQKLLKP